MDNNIKSLNADNLNNMIDRVVATHIPITGVVSSTNNINPTNSKVNLIYTDRNVRITGLKNYTNNNLHYVSSNNVKSNKYSGNSSVLNSKTIQQSNNSNAKNTIFSDTINISTPRLNGVVVPANISNQVNYPINEKIANQTVQSAANNISDSNLSTTLQNSNIEQKSGSNNQLNNSIGKPIMFEEVDNNLVSNRSLLDSRIKMPINSSKQKVEPPVYGINPPPKKFFDK